MSRRVFAVAFPWLIFSGFVLAQALGGRIPNTTPEQTAALAGMNAGLAPLTQSLTAARTEIIAASLADPRNDAEVRTKLAAVEAAELAEANARAEVFAKIQASPGKLAPDQVAALAASGGVAGDRAQLGTTAIPHSTSAQANALFGMANRAIPLMQALTEARNAVTAAAFASPPSPAKIKAKVDAVGTAELNLANARATALARIQASANKLDSGQLAALVAMGGDFGAGGFTQPEPMDFQDHRGYVSLFDGKTLKDWDGNPKFWRVEDGAIVGQSTPANPSGNTYIVYRGIEAHDFTLRCEIKIEGDGGSGIQYRSRSGIPWRRPIAANLGPVNLGWMLTGPQADFWPSRIYSGQVYSENTPMGIEAYRGQVVEGSGMGARRLMGMIGTLEDLGELVKMNDWNEYTVIVRGPTALHILNGQLMAAFVDDDPVSSNNWSGYFGIEIEATTKVSVRNIWLRKIN